MRGARATGVAIRSTKGKAMRSILIATLLGTSLAGCAVAPEAPGEATIDEQATPATAVQTQDVESCTSYCNYGDFHCPSNPLMECYWFCYETCVCCDGVTTCFPNSPPID